MREMSAFPENQCGTPWLSDSVQRIVHEKCSIFYYTYILHHAFPFGKVHCVLELHTEQKSAKEARYGRNGERAVLTLLHLSNVKGKRKADEKDFHLLQ